MVRELCCEYNQLTVVFLLFCGSNHETQEASTLLRRLYVWVLKDSFIFYILDVFKRMFSIFNLCSPALPLTLPRLFNYIEKTSTLRD
jgi:hypothetical protein